MENPEKIEIEGLKTIHKLCKFGADHNMEGCSFTEIVERMFDDLAKDQAVPEWISAEDELPKRNLNVLLNLVVRKNGKPIKCIGFYSIEPGEESCFVLDDNFTVLKGVTHWMPLPDSPKSQEQKG